MHAIVTRILRSAHNNYRHDGREMVFYTIHHHVADGLVGNINNAVFNRENGTEVVVDGTTIEMHLPNPIQACKQEKRAENKRIKRLEEK